MTLFAPSDYRENNMEALAIKTVEQLKRIQRNRSHAAIIIEGALANELIIAGIVQPKINGQNRELEVPEQPIGSHLYPVFQILRELSRTNRFSFINENETRGIKIYPFSSCRREGN
jgi:hypothetical protein